MIEQQIEKLKTLQESYDAVATTIEVQLPAIADKIDNIQLPEIDTTELAKQGENPEATNSKILEEVQNKLTPLDAVLTELKHGKQEIASSINFKGTETNPEKSLSELALDIRKIQNVSKEFQTIDYMEDVVGMRSAMDFINDVATNDYAAYACYVLGAGSKFNVATNPNAMYMSDGTLIQSPNGEYEVVPYDGNSYGAVVLAYTGRSILTENLSGTIQLGLYGAKVDIPSIPSNVQFFFSKDCELNITAQAFNNSSIYDFFNSDIKSITNRFMAENKVVRNVNLPELTNVTTDFSIFYNCTSLMTVNLPKLSIADIGMNKGLFQNCTKLKSVYLPALIDCPYRFCQQATALEYCYVPTAKTFTANMFYGCTNLKEVYAPNVVSHKDNSLIKTSFTGCNVLENIVVGSYNVDMDISSWNPIGVLDKIDVNIRNNIALRIADRKDTTALTITFSQNVRNELSAETEAVFAAKNWNIAPAKTV